MTTPKKLIKDYFTEDFYTLNTKEVRDYLEKHFKVSDHWKDKQSYITPFLSDGFNEDTYFFTTNLRYAKFIDTETFKEIIGMTNAQTNKEFKLSDLVSGKHVVEYRDGNRRLVLDVGWVGVDKYRIGFDEYSTTMEHEDDTEATVVKVYELKNARIIPELLNDSNLTLVWERKEAPVETAQEKAKKEAEAQLSELSQQIEALQKQAEAIKESVGKM